MHWCRQRYTGSLCSSASHDTGVIFLESEVIERLAVTCHIGAIAAFLYGILAPGRGDRGDHAPE